MFFPEPIAREFAPPPPLRVTPARRLFAAITNAGADRVLFSPGGGWLRHNGAMRARTSTLHTYTYADALEALTRELAALKLARAVGHLYGEQAGPRIGLIGHQSVTGRLSQTAESELQLRQSRLMPQAVVLVAAARAHLGTVQRNPESRRLALQLAATQRILQHLQRPRAYPSEQVTARRLWSLDANST